MLTTLAEVAIALAGFSGIVAVLGGRARGDWSSADRLRLSLLLNTSFGAVLWSFAPLVLLSAEVVPATVWVVTSGGYSVYLVGVMIYRSRQIRAVIRSQEIMAEPRYAAIIGRACRPESVGRGPQIGPVATHLGHAGEEVEGPKEIAVDALGDETSMAVLDLEEDVLEVALSRGGEFESGSHSPLRRRSSIRQRTSATASAPPRNSPRSSAATPSAIWARSSSAWEANSSSRSRSRRNASQTTSSTDWKCPASSWARTSSFTSSGSDENSIPVV